MDTGTKSNKSAKDVPKQNVPLKVVIRHLPPTLNQETFLEQVSPLPQHDYIAFVKGDSSLGPGAFSRAYINFVEQEDLFMFTEKFDNYVFVDSKGNEYPAIVEYAPFQKVPKRKTKKPDSRKGTLEKDADYMKFVESLNNKDDADGPLTLEQVLEEIETKARINQENAGKVSTPLIDYLKRKREEKKMAKEDRKKKEDERRRKREEERRQRREKEREKAAGKYKSRSYYDDEGDDAGYSDSESPEKSYKLMKKTSDVKDRKSSSREPYYSPSKSDRGSSSSSKKSKSWQDDGYDDDDYAPARSSGSKRETDKYSNRSTPKGGTSDRYGSSGSERRGGKGGSSEKYSSGKGDNSRYSDKRGSDKYDRYESSEPSGGDRYAKSSGGGGKYDKPPRISDRYEKSKSDKYSDERSESSDYKRGGGREKGSDSYEKGTGSSSRGGSKYDKYDRSSRDRSDRYDRTRADSGGYDAYDNYDYGDSSSYKDKDSSTKSKSSRGGDKYSDYKAPPASTKKEGRFSYNKEKREARYKDTDKDSYRKGKDYGEDAKEKSEEKGEKEPTKERRGYEERREREKKERERREKLRKERAEKERQEKSNRPSEDVTEKDDKQGDERSGSAGAGDEKLQSQAAARLSGDERRGSGDYSSDTSTQSKERGGGGSRLRANKRPERQIYNPAQRAAERRRQQQSRDQGRTNEKEAPDEGTRSRDQSE